MESLKWQIYINAHDLGLKGIMLTILYDEPLYFYFSFVWPDRVHFVYIVEEGWR